MDGSGVNISDEDVRALFSDLDGPVAKIIEAATERVGDYQRETAPVSPAGSKYAPPGFLKSRTGPAQELHHDPDTGFVTGYAGTPTNRHGGAYPYPLSFISNPSGSTWNRGRKTKRPARNRFIQEALASLESFVWGSP